MSDFNCKHPDLIVQRNYGHRWVTCTECNTDFVPGNPARRFASLTSPETIEIRWCEEHLFGGQMESVHPCEYFAEDDPDQHPCRFVVLRSVEEGET